MYLDYVSLFWVIIGVLIAGILLGRIWSYISAQEEDLSSRRFVRGSSSYVLGMNYLISNQSELAIMELSRAAEQDPDAVEVHIVLGNLYREKGQVERAIQIHRSVLQKKGISPTERNLALFCLGLDNRSAGFVDRAIEMFEQLLELDRADEQAFSNLIKLYEEIGQLDKAYRLQQELTRLQRSDDYGPQALFEVQIGKKLMDGGEYDGSGRRFQRAIDLDPKTYPAYLYFGDLNKKKGELEKAIEMWETLVRINYKRAHLVYDRLKDAYDQQNSSEKMVALLKEVMENHQYDWRSRVFLARIYADRGEFDRGFQLLKEAAQFNPHNLAIHQRIWKLFSRAKFDSDVMKDYIKLTEELIFFLDPFVCIECGYRSTEFLWKCPNCHSWESLVEVKM